MNENANIEETIVFDLLIQTNYFVYVYTEMTVSSVQHVTVRNNDETKEIINCSQNCESYCYGKGKFSL